MSNVLVNDASLTAIANAIRTKNGLTDTYTPSEMAAAIVALTSGSGGDSGSTSGGDLPSNIKIGSVTFDANSSDTTTITHGGSTVPTIIFMIAEEIEQANVNATIGCIYASNLNTGISSSTALTLSTSAAVIVVSNVTTTTFDITPRSAAYPFLAGLTYRWVAWF